MNFLFALALALSGNAHASFLDSRKDAKGVREHMIAQPTSLKGKGLAGLARRINKWFSPSGKTACDGSTEDACENNIHNPHCGWTSEGKCTNIVSTRLARVKDGALEKTGFYNWIQNVNELLPARAQSDNSWPFEESGITSKPLTILGTKKAIVDYFKAPTRSSNYMISKQTDLSTIYITFGAFQRETYIGLFPLNGYVEAMISYVMGHTMPGGSIKEIVENVITTVNQGINQGKQKELLKASETTNKIMCDGDTLMQVTFYTFAGQGNHRVDSDSDGKLFFPKIAEILNTLFPGCQK